MKFINMGFASVDDAAAKEDDSLFCQALGFPIAFFDGMFPETYGTPFNPPTPPTPVYTGIDAVLEAYIPKGIRVGFVIYFTKPDTNSWSNAEAPYGSLCSMRIVFSDGNTVVIDQVCTSMQLTINHIRTWCFDRGYDPEYWVYFQAGREPGPGGPGGPKDYATNHGRYDKFSDSAGTIASPGYLRARMIELRNEEYLDTDADWQALGAVLATGDAARGTQIAAIRGFHETMQYIMDRVNFYNHILIGPSMECQISAPWLSVSSPNSLVSVNTNCDRARATFYPVGFDYYERFDILAIDIYIGDHRAVANMSAFKFGAACKAMANQVVRRLRQGTTRSVFLKPVWVMEVGGAANWIPNVTQELRGEYAVQIMKHMLEIPGVNAVGFYRGKNYSSSEDALNSNANFGLKTSAGVISAGANALAVSNGQPPISTSLPDAPIASGSSTE